MVSYYPSSYLPSSVVVISVLTTDNMRFDHVFFVSGLFFFFSLSLYTVYKYWHWYATKHTTKYTKTYSRTFVWHFFFCDKLLFFVSIFVLYVRARHFVFVTLFFSLHICVKCIYFGTPVFFFFSFSQHFVCVSCVCLFFFHRRARKDTLLEKFAQERRFPSPPVAVFESRKSPLAFLVLSAIPLATFSLFYYAVTDLLAVMAESGGGGGGGGGGSNRERGGGTMGVGVGRDWAPQSLNKTTRTHRRARASTYNTKHGIQKTVATCCTSTYT